MTKSITEKSIKELRNEMKLTQGEVSKLVGIPLRTYKNYENDPSKIGSIKYTHILRTLSEYTEHNEERGVLTVDNIKKICFEVLKNYDVEYCILFGSYAQGVAGDKSDIDLLVSTKLTGLKFFGLVEDLRGSLGKKVDLLDTRQLVDNVDLMNSIFKEGIRIFKK